MSSLDAVCWRREQLGNALAALVRETGLSVGREHVGEVPSESPLGEWMELAAARLGLEVEPVNTPYRELEELIQHMGPALLALPGGGALALLRVRRTRAQVVTPNLTCRWVSVAAIRDALAAPLEARARPALERVLREAGVPDKRRGTALATILRTALGGNRCAGGWLLRLPPEAPIGAQARAAGLHRALFWLITSHAANYLLFIGAWALIGRGALAGDLDAGWLTAWALALATQVPLSMATTWLQGRFAIDASALLKRRMLQGALRLTPDETRTDGVGRFIGRINESEAVEALALGGGLNGALALIELTLAGIVLAAGSGGAIHVSLLLIWLALIGSAAFLYTRRHRTWSEERVQMTFSLVERMVGYRTRLAQQPPERWHPEEDRELRRYADASTEMDRWAVGLSMVTPCWLVAGVLGLAPAFAAGADTTGVAVALGGVLLAHGALAALTGGLVQLVGALVAWERARPLFDAAERPERIGDPSVALPSPAEPGADPGPVLSARDLSFRYPTRSNPVLERCSLQIEDGDQILLRGPSGGGKSTLSSLLVGLRSPDRGLLLLRGFDRPTLGEAGWRRRVVAAPQFHENHVLTGTFAFNLLMGRAWPPSEEDLREAETICRELGLGELLERMPAGLLQTVGDTGWQLSHGERSRLFIARALIQGADLVVLDENFASLDPENLQRALRCVRDRANSLVVIAHP